MNNCLLFAKTVLSVKKICVWPGRETCKILKQGSRKIASYIVLIWLYILNIARKSKELVPEVQATNSVTIMSINSKVHSCAESVHVNTN